MNKLKITGNWFFYTLFCASLALTWFFHKDATRFADRNGLWSDRAGYYIYLPATFFYHFDTHRMPVDLDIITGGGFSIDTVKNKIDTKYTYGVSLMVSPFFLTAGLVSRIGGFGDENGFSMLYMRMMGLAAVIYLLLGLWFLKKFLDFYFPPQLSLLVITLLFLGTNLFFYSVIDGMMSHVFSFFLFALFLYAIKRYQASQSYSWFILLSITLSLAILVRPTNIIAGILFFTWDAAGVAGFSGRIRQFLKPSRILVFLAILFVTFMPQLIYWRYLSGHWLHFSYGNEGFANLPSPRFAEVLFSPVNGLFPYVPLALFFVAGIGMMLFRKRANGWPVALVFLLVTTVCASWKMWYFGCSLGQRSFIEYYAILAVPFGYFLTWLFSLRKIMVSTLLFFVLFLFVYFNLRYTVGIYRFERCYYGSTWDWGHYYRTLGHAGILSTAGRIRSYENDFENLALSPVTRPSQLFTRSGLYSIAASEKGGHTPLYSVRLDELGYPYPKMIDVEIWMLKPGTRPAGALLGYSLNRGTEILFSDEQPVDSLVKKPLTWLKVSKRFIVPDVNDSSLLISIFVVNPKNVPLYSDDLKIKFHYNWN
ncbi:MAG: hypothetical protein WCK34_15655 [Bacteroidota bacterium]